MNIFLTGSTGFLGKKLIKNLVKNQQHSLYVLVRNVEKANDMLATSFSPEEQECIEIIKGDITLPNFGFSDDQVDRLQGNIDIFYHLAALVKFDTDLRDELFNINYGGTKHALELATHLQVEKFFYVSTAYTVGKREIGIESLYPEDNPAHNPYEESKIKSEHLALSYQGKMDVSIFRPSIIVGDSKTGEADSHFTLYGFMRALDLFRRRVKRSKDENQTYRVIASSTGTSNFVPVDYVADILSHGVKSAEGSKIYHITNPNPPSNHDMLQILKKALNFEELEIVEQGEVDELTEDEKRLNQMIGVFAVYLGRAIRFNDANTQELISNSNVDHLQLSQQTMNMIVNAYFTVNE
ncbi:NAD-dependent epimerase/dehydratase family protein [Pontibacillus yanchengensis]|uniref:NAD-dependent epimerase/dehydratase family protein n=2 Tax=Pontibacillus yanchengensis TaxID=462910 RepID=A0ACC7VHJ4_9BACI|nr:SDR family oxidoreductase [Pontibacillus yanchengensis]MYL33642.1 NAD-dependent epimerase/dehydratase family protein [Pontibacillus yanchengensis]MYL54155.1 NAD-dependent epimerase/dehydratase family protein [Pontibacillus yanchengensis]